MPKFITKPVEVEAVQWAGDNREEVEALDPEHVAYYRHTNSFMFDTPDAASCCDTAAVGDYIVKDAEGLLHKFTDEEFYKTFEPAEDL